jgi:hypothetical protein
MTRYSRKHVKQSTRMKRGRMDSGRQMGRRRIVVPLSSGIGGRCSLPIENADAVLLVMALGSRFPFGEHVPQYSHGHVPLHIAAKRYRDGDGFGDGGHDACIEPLSGLVPSF